MKKILLSILSLSIAVSTAFAQEDQLNKRVYTSFGGNGGILSFANVKDNGETVTSVPRYTLFFNIGTNYNYDFSDHFGVFSGTNIKNIGLITKDNSVKIKQRVYTLGVPLGIKIGDLHDGFMFFTGAEADLAFNYKQKTFVDGDKKEKFNEWFSKRTPLLMPSVFAGFQFNDKFNLKFQYYLNNFFNQDYKDNNGVKPYQNTDARLFFVTIGYNFKPKKIFDRRRDS